MNILVTGGAGGLGARLVPLLIERGETVVLMDLRAPNTQANPALAKAKFVKTDIGQQEGVFDVVRGGGFDSMIHLAAILSADSERRSDAAWRANVEGTRNVLEACRQFSVKRLLVASTLATYGPELPAPLPIDAPQWPTSLYGVTKIIAERLGVYYHHRFGLDFRAIRLPAVAGPGSAAGGASGYVSAVFEQSFRTGRYEFHVRPTTREPVVYIADAVQAIIGLHDALADRLTRRVYNVAGIAPSAEELAKAVQKRLSNIRITYKPDPLQVSIVESWPTRIDDSDATRDWGWASTCDLDQMADAFIRELSNAHQEQ